MRIAFCTCVKLGLSCIEAVVEDGGRFALFLTLHDRKSRNKSGRVYLDDISARTGTPLYKLNHVNDPDVAEVLREHRIDWLFIIGWSQIASPELLAVPTRGVIGAHPTLLPEGRGRAAIPWAILKGLTRTGVTFFKMDAGVDTGPILDSYEIPVGPRETATELYAKVNDAHVSLMRQIWPKLLSDGVVGRVQDESAASYWEGRTPADGELRASMTVREVDLLVRATTRPYPGAFLTLDNGDRMVVWSGGMESSEGARALSFADGVFYAWEVEVVPRPASS